jgi:iron complex transport system substrate-binding protein
MVLSLLIVMSIAACTADAKPPASPPADAEDPGAALDEAGESVDPTMEAGVFLDGMAREVSLAQLPERILSIAPSSTEILYAIGAGPLLVGRDDLSDYPPEVVDLASIGSTFGDLNTEAIVALEPDLVVAARINSPEHIAAIETLNIPVYVIPNPLSFDDLFESLLAVGKLTGNEPGAQALIARLDARVDNVLDRVAGSEPVSVYFEVDGTDPTAPWTIGSGTFQDVIISMAGGENVAGDLELYIQLSLEELVERDAQVMIFSQADWVPTTPESVAARPGWGDITAVANGAVYGIDTNWIDRPGPRLVDALEATAAILHPTRFE